MTHRVVITGMGAITPIGLNVADAWKSAKEGRCGVAPITRFDTSDYRVHLACEAKDFIPENFMEKKEARRMDRYCQLAVAAAQEAVTDANLDMEKVNPERCAVLVGSGVGGLETTEAQSLKLRDSAPGKVAPLLVPMLISNMAAGHIAMRHGFKGSNTCIVTACATGTHAIGEAFRMIKHGYADVCVSGGAEASITTLALAGFSQIQALTECDDPMRASIPFDAERSGFVMGEGAGILVLEDYDHAVARGAKIYGEVVGYGSTCDAYHMTAPHPEGEGAARAMKLAMEEGGITPDQVGYVNAHGTSTPPNDKTETAAIKAALGEENAHKTPVSSTKSMTGHLLGAAGAVEAIFCTLAMRDSFIPPTIGYKVPDSQCDLDYVPNVGRSAQVEYSLSNSMGFGGHNGALLLKKTQQ